VAGFGRTRAYSGGDASLSSPATAWTTNFPGRAWQLDDGDELGLVAQHTIPAHLVPGTDLGLHLRFASTSDESVNDEFRFDLDFVSLRTEDLLSKAASSVVQQVQVITETGVQYKAFDMAINVPEDDATNPIAADDLLRFVLTHRASGGVAQVVVVAANLLVPVISFAQEG